MYEKLSRLLVEIPTTLTKELCHEFENIKTQYILGHREHVLISAGRFCEIVYSFLDGKNKLSYPAHATKPQNFLLSCESLQNANGLSESERIIIPRVLIAIYTFRNKRNGGHIGENKGRRDKDDADIITSMVKWVLSELVREFCGADDVAEGQGIIQQINENWEIIWTGPDNIARISRPGISVADQTLLLLARSTSLQLPTEQLLIACEYKNASRYRNDIIEKLTKKRYIFLELHKDILHLMPEGIKRAEKVASHFVEEYD